MSVVNVGIASRRRVGARPGWIARVDPALHLRKVSPGGVCSGKVAVVLRRPSQIGQNRGAVVAVEGLGYLVAAAVQHRLARLAIEYVQSEVVDVIDGIGLQPGHERLSHQRTGRSAAPVVLAHRGRVVGAVVVPLRLRNQPVRRQGDGLLRGNPQDCTVSTVCNSVEVPA